MNKTKKIKKMNNKILIFKNKHNNIKKKVNLSILNNKM